MNICLAYSPHDEAQAHRWLNWCAELQAGIRHDLTVLPFKGLNPPQISGWKSVTILRDYSGIRGDWSSNEPVRDAAGPNFMFREMARHFYEKKTGAWLWMEPDTDVLVSTAFDQIEAEYLNCGHPFMGTTGTGEPKHMSGVAVYPERLAVTAQNYMRPRLATIGARTVEGAFNLAGAPDALPRFHDTKLIRQAHRPEPFSSIAQVEQLIAQGVVIFHSDKSGSALPFVRSIRSDATAGNGFQGLPGQLKPCRPPCETISIPAKTPKRRMKRRTAQQQEAINARMAKVRAARVSKKAHAQTAGRSHR